METTSNKTLDEKLADALPEHSRFKFYHVSTPPTKCSAIYSPPPGAKPEPTYCESHFLNVSVRPSDSKDADQVFALAIEILVYTTKHLTTLFVSKADSTGYLSLLTIPKGHSSPLRSITSTFVSYLVESRQRKNVKSVVSLFARASDQYLFPGSVENDAKHVSDDRQLVKWWCRVLDPVLRSYTAEANANPETDAGLQDETETTAQAYIIVPGEDSILSFLPPEVRQDPSLRKRWASGHPLREISSHPAAPPRCLIPHFPDDPKNRLLDDLDEELPDSQTNDSNIDSPSKRGTGKWRSVHTIEQFWLTMEQRSECSAGRLVGFMWVVFTPPACEAPSQNDRQGSLTLPHESGILSLPSSHSSKAVSPRKANSQRRKPLTGVIVPRVPRIKSTSSNLTSTILHLPTETKYYIWPSTSRGDIVLDEKKYKKATELLLRLDFANRRIAEASTRTWIDELAVLGGREAEGWGREVEGKKARSMQVQASAAATVMNTMQIKRKAVPADAPASLSKSTPAVETGVNTLQPRKRAKLVHVDALNGVGKENEIAAMTEPAVNVLSSHSVRKKAKKEGSTSQEGDASGVNVLCSGLVRKKPKAT
ncbi:putative dna damage response protein rtt109 protein [Venturia nashicola]|nr:putative dna damage response protein rtt109 protein [Venturia nashicola]